jgi:hypothetical protein
VTVSDAQPSAERPITDEERHVARRLWPDDEETDFTVRSGTSADGTIWTWLRCSAHGGVMASVEWDLGMLNIAAEGHYVRKHLRANRNPPQPNGAPS